jgi:hypothetical protein
MAKPVLAIELWAVNDCCTFSRSPSAICKLDLHSRTISASSNGKHAYTTYQDDSMRNVEQQKQQKHAPLLQTHL